MKALFLPDYPFDTLFIPHILKEIYFDDIYRPALNKKGKDLVAIDAGANIGLVTQFLRPFARKIYAIEPSPEHYQCLLANKAFNQWDNVECFDLALSDLNGWTGLNRFNVNRTCNSTVFNRDTSDTVTVKTIRLDTFLEDNKIEHVDLLKLDIEGAEELVLRDFASVAPKIDMIHVEFHTRNPTDMAEYLRTLGYECARINTRVVAYLFWKE